MSGRRIVDIREESCRVYEGHFFPYLVYSATGLAFVLQLFFRFCFIFFLLHLCVRVHCPIPHVCTLISVMCPCACLSELSLC